MIVSKTVVGVLAEGYPRTYYGRNAFTHNSVNYPAIDSLQMATMPVVDYETRLAAYKAYVEGLESGLDVDETTVVGSEAYRENTTACPII